MKAVLHFLLVGCLMAGGSCSSNNKIDPRVLTVPSFNFLRLDNNSTFNTSDITGGSPVILMYFSPDCPYSRQQTENILSNYAALQGIRFYMCSSFPLPKLNNFYRHYQLNRYKNIVVGRDYELFFQNQLKVPSFPWLFIYAADKRLKKIITGNADTQTILDMLKS